MAKSAATSAVKSLPRFRVSLKGYPVMGFVDRIEKPSGEVSIEILSSLPAVDHFRARKPEIALDEGIDDGWLTARQLQELYGLDPKEFDQVDSAKWRKRKRVRMDLTGAMFEGAVIEASSEYEARDVFRKRYGVRNTQDALWSVSPTEEPLGPYGPKKLRGLLAQS